MTKGGVAPSCADCGDAPIAGYLNGGGHPQMALVAPSGGGFALVAATLGLAEARRRARARHRAAFARAQTLCENLAERIGWLQRPDDPSRIPDVVWAAHNEAVALEICVGRLPGPQAGISHPTAEELVAMIDAVDAEVRLALLGHPEARARARRLAATVRAGAAALTYTGAA